MSVKFILLIFAVLMGYVLGYVFTETKYDLQRWKVFDFKAFKCRPCLTFHISWVLSVFISCFFNDWFMMMVGIGFSFGMFILLKIDEQQRFKE